DALRAASRRDGARAINNWSPSNLISAFIILAAPLFPNRRIVLNWDHLVRFPHVSWLDTSSVAGQLERTTVPREPAPPAWKPASARRIPSEILLALGSSSFARWGWRSETTRRSVPHLKPCPDPLGGLL